MTKLAAEHLCSLYASSWAVPAVALRYFSVYGPRQRPDMAFHRLCQAIVTNTPFPLFGDGSQVRDFTYVADVVAANLATAVADVEPGTVLNVSGGASTSMVEVIELLGELSGAPVPIDRQPTQAGDVMRTGGSSDLRAGPARLGTGRRPAHWPATPARLASSSERGALARRATPVRMSL